MSERVEQEEIFSQVLQQMLSLSATLFEQSMPIIFSFQKGWHFKECKWNLNQISKIEALKNAKK